MTQQAMSWGAEVIADSTGKWLPNAARFATKEEAQAYINDVALRWMAVSESRVVEYQDAVNFRWVDDGQHRGIVLIQEAKP